MKRAIFACLALLAMGAAPALAAEKAPDCRTLAQFKQKGRDTVAAMANLAKVSGGPAPELKLPDAFTPIKPARFHFLQGVYAMNPQTPPGLPPGDGATLATFGRDPGGEILWTKGDLNKGGLICGAAMPVPKALLDLMDGKIADSPGEGAEL